MDYNNIYYLMNKSRIDEKAKLNYIKNRDWKLEYQKKYQKKKYGSDIDLAF